MNKYHTVVDQFWHSDWQTDAIGNWLTADHVRHIAATSLSLLQQLRAVDNGILYGRCERLFVTDLSSKYFTWQIFYKRYLSG